MLLLLVPGPHFEEQGLQLSPPQCQGSQCWLGIRIKWGVFLKKCMFTLPSDFLINYFWNNGWGAEFFEVLCEVKSLD